jgi:hypothetical protein
MFSDQGSPTPAQQGHYHVLIPLAPIRARVQPDRCFAPIRFRVGRGSMQASASDQATTLAAVHPPTRDGVGTVKTHLSAETLQLYARAWARFARFCTEHGRTAFPASTDVVSAFLLQSGAGRAALARYLAAIDHKHRQNGLAPPGDDPGLRAVLRSARKTAPRAGRRSAPTPAHLHRLAQCCPGDLAGRRDRALLLLAAAGLGRATLVGLEAERLRFSERGVSCVVTGIETGRQIEVARSVGIASCPVRALEDWLRVSATRYGPVFRKVNRWGRVEDAALGRDAIRLILVRRTAELR